MMVVCGESLEEVTQWAATDPYNKIGLFASTTVAPWTSLDVINRAFPNAPGPGIESWYELKVISNLF
ncbi:hypothetical protein T492DRAFT_376954 [Pavlovales sp. CCMP2436]|nr:hypothetical protein T492DRAFT_376954 [Pavlovales sp. CCMP2436]